MQRYVQKHIQKSERKFEQDLIPNSENMYHSKSEFLEGLTKTTSKKEGQQSRKRKFTINPEFIKTLPKPIIKHTKFKNRAARGKIGSCIRKYK